MPPGSHELRASTRIGTEVAGFRIESVLGRGGMSVVYVAEQIRLARKVALKVLTNELAWDEQFRERFVRESHIAATIDHPNIIPIYDAGEADGLLYIAMRFVQGPDLKEILKRGTLGVGRTIFLIEQLASALDAAHAHALVHRDVKPGNILVEESTDHAYLTDFGVAKQTTARGLTSTGHFLGTVEYAAPEQIEGGPVGARTDVYALGCVLYESLTGSPPFAHGTEHAVLHAHLVDPPPSVSRVRPDLPQAFDSVVATAMAKVGGGPVRIVRRARPRCSQRGERNGTARRRQPAGSRRDDRLDSGFRPGRAGRNRSRRPLPPSYRPSPLRRSRAGRHATDSSQADAADAAPGRPRSDRIRPRRLLPDRQRRHRRLRLPPHRAPSSTSSPTSCRRRSGTPARRAQGRARERSKRRRACRRGCQRPSHPTTSRSPPSRAAQPSSAAYEAERRLHGVAPDQGKCNGVSWGGEGKWFHNPVSPGTPPAHGGSRFCYFDGTDAVIVWTHRKLGQPTHTDLLGIAREGGSDHPGLFGWWRFWHHRLGKVLG